MVEFDVDGGIKGFGHRPILGPRIVRNVPSLPAAAIERFRTAFVPDVSDAVGVLYTMDTGIHPLYRPIKRLVGRALTVKAPPGDNVTVHGALNMAQAGDVLVIDWRGYTEGCATGAGSLIPAISRGLAGAIVDGGWRDVVELQALDFPVFGRSVAPFSPPKSRPGEINVPVSCGGVVVHAGDLILADDEGVVVVPRDAVQPIADSLRDYEPHMSMESWDLEHLKAQAVTRQKYYDALFSSRGGTYVDWPGGPSQNVE